MDKQFDHGDFDINNTGVGKSQFGYKGNVETPVEVVKSVQARFANLDPTNVAGYVIIVATHAEGEEGVIDSAVELGGPAEIREFLIRSLLSALENLKIAEEKEQQNG